MNKTAIILGATGLVGSHLTHLLLEDDRYASIKIFHRRSTGITHKKLKEYVIDFDAADSWKEQITGDELYSAMGTTIKAAGSKDIQRKIDVIYPLTVARNAAENGVKKYSQVSSSGANKDSLFFYPRIKGELEEAVKELPFELCTIMRPSILEGERNEKRAGEAFGITVMNILCKIPGLSKHRPIHAKTVAKGMIHSLNNLSGGSYTFESEQIFNL